jgi:predicted cobalt transporter CbtA
MAETSAGVNRIYKFVAGNSRVTPIGIALAVALAVVLRGASGSWAPGIYLSVLAVTLAISTLEPVQ